MARATKRGQRDRVSKLVGELEAAAKKLRTDLLKRAEATGTELQKAANQLRKRAATVAAQVEKQVHQVRKELEKSTKKRPAKKRKAAARKR